MSNTHCTIQMMSFLLMFTCDVISYFYFESLKSRCSMMFLQVLKSLHHWILFSYQICFNLKIILTTFKWEISIQQCYTFSSWFFSSCLPCFYMYLGGTASSKCLKMIISLENKHNVQTITSKDDRVELIWLNAANWLRENKHCS